MTISAQSGIFSYGMQSAKSTTNVLDPTQVKANVAVNATGAIAAPTSPAIDSKLAFTVDVALGAGDVSIEIIGQDANGDYQAEIVEIPANSPVGTVVWTTKTWNATTGITSMQILEASAAGQVDIGAYDVATGVASTFYRHLASDINFGPVQDMRTFPLELGGIITPTGAYKAGVFVGGGATIQPRMEGDFGWLLKGLMGAVATTANSPVAGAHTHVFKFATDVSDLPWMTVRKHIPGPNPLGEIGLDCKMVSARVNFPQNGIISARVDFVGREPQLDESPGSWTYADAFETFESVPVTCTVNGSVKFPAAGAKLPITSLVVVMANNLTSPQQEMIIGSPYPDDFVPLSRAMTIQATLKWENPDLYQQILTGNVAGTTWDPAPFTTTFEVIVEAVGIITGSTKYQLKIEAEKVMWNVAGPPALAGGDILMLPLVGTVLQPSSGDYAKFTMVNGQASY